MADYKQLCTDLVDALIAHGQSDDAAASYVKGLLTRARAALAEPEPKELTDHELQKLLYFEFTTSTGHGRSVDYIGFARAVLARWGRHAPPAADDSKLRDAALLALTTLEGWSNYNHWLWPISTMEQSKRETVEALAALRTALKLEGQDQLTKGSD